MRHGTERLLSLLICFAVLTAPSFSTAEERGAKVVSDKEQVNLERRIALVIGNAAYDEAPLLNPVNDAGDMAAQLQQLGFQVMLRKNATRREMEVAIREFGDALKPGGAGLFYYAGHGMQVNDRNYLIPLDADIEREDEIPYKAVDAGQILGKMETAGNRLNIVILDACRQNPFARSFRSSTQGLAQMDAPRGSLIVYATAPGSVSYDGNGRNGTFTKHLLSQMRTPDLEIGPLLRRVRESVRKETSERQIPWESSSIEGNFYFIASASASVTSEGKMQYQKETSRVEAAPEQSAVSAPRSEREQIPQITQSNTEGQATPTAAHPTESATREQKPYGRLEGRITDSNGKPVEVYVELYKDEKRLGYTESDVSLGGMYKFAKLEPGTYEIRVKRPGGEAAGGGGVLLLAPATRNKPKSYQTQQIFDVSVQRGARTILDVKVTEGEGVKQIEKPQTRSDTKVDGGPLP